MVHRVLPKPEWQSYFDRLSKGLVGKRAHLEVGGIFVGNQTEADALPIIGITYDPKDDFVEIALEGIDHIIHKPREIYVIDGIDGLHSMEIVDSERRKQVMTLNDPVMISVT